ncbi:MAG: DUF1835 domain-containing protein [Bacteroidetes bacterium]|nr:DUF1835 domain-containing protein [Bacteroidota bacterium]MDA1332816.1 DUF1835 domain-containing protein [Bacteroidota bacterium]
MDSLRNTEQLRASQPYNESVEILTMLQSERPLIVTNGDAARRALEEAGVPADIITWDDVLHDGPVPWTDDNESLRAIRAAFISSKGWQEEADVLDRFLHRDRQLMDAVTNREIVLWFEHDLYDQLQFWQVISMLPEMASVTWICEEEFVTEHDADALQALWPKRQSLNPSMRETASRLWHAFRAPDPCVLAAMRDIEMPFAKATIDRWIELYPDMQSGLDRIETFVLNRLRGGPLSFGQLFREASAMEEAAFLGDSSFMALLNEIAQGDEALLSITGEDKPQTARIELTTSGYQRLTLDQEWGKPIRERWVGGVLLEPGNWWFWDRNAGAFFQRSTM